MVPIIFWRLLDGCCYFLDLSEWFLFFSWTLLGGCYFFLWPSGWLLIFAIAFWMVPVFSWRVLNGCSTGEVAHNHAYCLAIDLVLEAQEIAIKLRGAHNNCRNSLQCS